jgi:phosphatidate phosphatase APP1
MRDLPPTAKPPFDLSELIWRGFIWFRRQYRLAFRGLRDRWNRHLTTEVMPYVGYASTSRAFVKGRVLKDRSITPATPTDSRWRNLVNTYKRFTSHDVPHAKVRVSLGTYSYLLKANEEGYVEGWLRLPEPLVEGWQEARFELLEPAPREGAGVTYGKVLVPPASCRLGVISDIDDTVMQTDARRWLKVIFTVLVGNAVTRVPFKGVAAFYQALQQGARGDEHNPLFYVSSSPWNLFDLLQQFLELEKIPLGPLMLRNWGITARERPTVHGSHKNAAIHDIMHTFPELPFILIGDSGQEDPEIYRNVVHDFPERVLAVYIRNVSDTRRAGAIRALAEEVEKAGSELILADDMRPAAQHAAERGWIRPEAVAVVEAAKRADDHKLP